MSGLAMRPDELPDHVAHFRARVLHDALAEATAAYWHRRADALETALPRPGDYLGKATEQERNERRQRLAAQIAACRRRAELSLGGRA